MAAEDEILRTLQRIESLLKSSAQTSGAGSTAGGRSGGGVFAAARSKLLGDKSKQKTFQATSKSVDSLGDAADDVAKRFGKLSKTVYATQAQFTSLNKSMRVFNRAPSKPGAGPADPAGGGGGGNGGGARNPIADLFGNNSPVAKNAKGLSQGMSFFKAGLIGIATDLKGIFIPVLKDMMMLAGRGIDTSSMIGLYTDAVKAGMGLREYTKVLEESSPAVLRAGSFEEFGKRLQDSSKQLAGLGIFGSEATRLSAAMQTSATTLGVPQGQLADSTSRQVKVFADLRKTSMMTSDAFQQLTQDVASNDNVQSELLGLSGNERAARLEELTRTRALGVTMGLSAEESKKLGDALLAQRKLTAVQRFQAAGTLRQAGAVLGMGAGDANELSSLALKKNRTTEESARFAELGGQMQEAIEKAQNSGNIQQEAMADQLTERLRGTGISEQLEAAGKSRLTQQSGPVLRPDGTPVNRDIGKTASDSVQDIGRIATVLEGLGKNPVYEGVSKALTSASVLAALSLAIRGPKAVAGDLADAAGALGNLGGKGVGGAGAMGVMSRLLVSLPAIGNGILSLSNLSSAQDDKKNGVEGADKRENEAIGMGIGGTAGAAIGVVLSGFLAAFTGGIGALATGAIVTATTAAGSWIGNTLGGWMTKDKTTDKNTAEVKKNTDEVKKNTATIAGPSILTSSANLASQVASAARSVKESTDIVKPVATAAAATTTAETKDQMNARLLKQARDEVYNGSNPNATEGDVNKRFKELLANPQSMAAAIQTAAIATPTDPARTGVTQPDVNTAATTAATAAATAATAATASGSTTPPVDQATQLATIITLLQQMLTAEQAQAAAMQLLRPRPVFGDNDVMTDRMVLASD